MPSEPKDKPETFDADDKCADDQKKRGYYYDDAHGYETYEPGEDDEENEAETTSSAARSISGRAYAGEWILA